jgi:hypothetical protein
MDARKVSLTETEAQLFYDGLVRRRFYKGMDCPLGNPWSDWMQDTIDKLKPLVRRTYDKV